MNSCEEHGEDEQTEKKVFEESRQIIPAERTPNLY